MMIRLYPNKVLREKAVPVVNFFDGRFQRLVNRMFKTLHRYGGLGLSANQIGEPIRLMVVDVPGYKRMALVNPHLMSFDGEEKSDEGCLSLPGIIRQIRRPATISLIATTRFKKDIKVETGGLLARVIMHEMDHMQGRLIIDEEMVT